MDDASKKIYERMLCDIDNLKFHLTQGSCSFMKLKKEVETIDTNIRFFYRWDLLSYLDVDDLHGRLQELLTNFFSSYYM